MAAMTMLTHTRTVDVRPATRTKVRHAHDAFGWSRAATWWVIVVGAVQVLEVTARAFIR